MNSGRRYLITAVLKLKKSLVLFGQNLDISFIVGHYYFAHSKPVYCMPRIFPRSESQKEYEDFRPHSMTVCESLKKFPIPRPN